MYFGSNIKLLRKRKGRTQDDIAFALKMKRSTLSGYENNIAQPGLKNLIAIAEYFDISIDTLLKVNLFKLSESQLSQIERGFDVYVKGSKLRVLTTTIDSENNENIELVPEKAKAGYSRGFADPDYISNLPVFQLPFLSKQKKYRAFQISGESMLPIPHGSWITGEFIQDWNDLKNQNAYIILTFDEGIVFKIIENRIEECRKLKLYSLNPLYESYEISVSEIKEIWKFINFISEEIPEPRLPQNDLITTIANLKHDMDKIKGQLSQD
jgi:DNA-binding XRE family transcriptional regulator